MQNLRIALVALVIVESGASATAQPFQGDFIVAGALNRISDAVYRINRTSFLRVPMVRGITSGSSRHYAWEVIMAENNQDLYALSAARFSSLEIIKMDPSGTIISTVFTAAGGTIKNATNLFLDQNGKLVLLDTTGSSSSGKLFEVDPVLKTLTTIAAFPKGDLYYGSAARDIDTGDYLAFLGDSVIRIDRALGMVTTPVVTSLSIARMGFAQDARTGKAYGGTCCRDTLWQFDLVKGAASVLVGPKGFWANDGLVFDRRVDANTNWLYNAYAGPSTNGIARIDMTGVVNVVTAWPAGFGSLVPYSLAIEGSNEVQPFLRRAPNDRGIHLAFIGHARKLYVCAISLSGLRPGVTLGDGRMLNLVPDAIAMASLRGVLDSFIPNRVGVLDAGGRATTGLELNALGAAVRGLSVTFQVVVLDPAAPLGIAVVAEPYTIKLE